MRYALRDTIRLGTLIVGKEPQGVVNICSAGRSVDYMQLVIRKVWISKDS